MIGALEDVNWTADAVTMNLKNLTPIPAITHYLTHNKGIGDDRMTHHSFNQYFLPIQDALELQLRYYQVEIIFEEVLRIRLVTFTFFIFLFSQQTHVYVRSLEQCHAQVVYDNWPYSKVATTLQTIVDEIVHLPSAGVFLKSTDELVSWMTYHPPMGMGKLHTLENHRKQGYAGIVTRYLSKRLAQTGLIPFVLVMPGNQASQKLFESVGFRLLRTCHNLHTHR